MLVNGLLLLFCSIFWHRNQSIWSSFSNRLPNLDIFVDFCFNQLFLFAFPLLESFLLDFGLEIFKDIHIASFEIQFADDHQSIDIVFLA